MATFGSLYTLEPPWKRMRDAAYDLTNAYAAQAQAQAGWTAAYGTGVGDPLSGYFAPSDAVVVEAAGWGSGGGGGGGGGGPRIEQVGFPYTSSVSTRPYGDLAAALLPGAPASDMSLGQFGSAGDVFTGIPGVTGPPDHVQPGRRTDTEIVQSIHVLYDPVINDGSDSGSTFVPGALVFQYKDTDFSRRSSGAGPSSGFAPPYKIATLQQMNRWLYTTPGARSDNPFDLMFVKPWEATWHFLGVFIADSTQGRFTDDVSHLSTIGLFILKRAVVSDLWAGSLRPGDDVMLELRMYSETRDWSGRGARREYYWRLVPIVPTPAACDSAASFTRLWERLPTTLGHDGVPSPIRVIRLGTVIVPASSHTLHGPPAAWNDTQAMERAMDGDKFGSTREAMFSSAFDTFEVCLTPT